jgi:glycosyltransferase involved in cell wall biosynthesis
MSKRRLCVLGDFDGYFSHNVVSLGVAEAFMTSGAFEVGVFDVNRDIEASYHDCELVMAPHAADVCFFVGGYPPMLATWKQKFCDRPVPCYALAICESSLAPADWRAVCDPQLGGPFQKVWAPSVWCGNALGVEVARHGVSPALFRHVTGDTDERYFLHVCGAASFPERKGTPQLIEAWRAYDDSDLPLRILGEASLRELLEPGDNIEVREPKGGRPRKKIAKLYARAAAVIQPSRAEAFGLVPLEAELFGRPVVATACAGHAEFKDRIHYVVEHGPAAPIAVNGIPNGSAPTVTAAAIYDALCALDTERPLPGKLASPWYWRNTMAHVRAYIEERHA